MKLTVKLATLAAIAGLLAGLAGSFAGSAKATLIPPIRVVALKPDLVVSSDGVYVKVTNQGYVAANPFYVSISASSGNTCWLDGSETRYIGGLAAGTSYTFRLMTTSDAQRIATVDSTNMVAETNEGNNWAAVPALFTAC